MDFYISTTFTTIDKTSISKTATVEEQVRIYNFNNYIKGEIILIIIMSNIIIIMSIIYISLLKFRKYTNI